MIRKVDTTVKLKSIVPSHNIKVEIGEMDNEDLAIEIKTHGANIMDLMVEGTCTDFDIDTVEAMFDVNEILYELDAKLWPIFAAIVSVDGLGYAICAAESKFDRYNLYPGITNCEELGRHWLFEGASFEVDKVPEVLIKFFDFEAYGEHLTEAGGSVGTFTDWGFLEGE